jgi:two-component system sensor histidine kinase KdpD
MRSDEDRERLIATFANGVALALEQERLSAEEQAAAVARESDRLKSVLLSSVSHDLRTPLAGIKAAIGSLLRRDVQWSEEDRQAFLRDIDGEADRLTRLVSNLLDLSRIEAGAIRPRKEWETIPELIFRVVSRLEPQLKVHPVRIDVPGDLPLVRLDAVQMEQVLTNLLENAAKYSPPGTPITVGSRLADEPGASSTLCLSVADCGPGIEPAEQKYIFEKFYRVTGSKRPVSGTGMGLAIVKGLVEAHGGRVVLESAPGQGSTFTVILPVERGDGVMSLSSTESHAP